MINFSILRRGFYSILFLVSLVLAGCTKTEVVETPPPPSPEPACAVPQATRLAEVIEATQATLASRQCDEKFDAFYENLLSVGREDRKPENKKLMRAFIQWSIDEGILGRKTGRQYYGTYFSTSLMCAPEYPDICNDCRRLDNLKSEIDEELQKKQVGLLWVCDDKANYEKALRIAQELKWVLMATCNACQE